MFSILLSDGEALQAEGRSCRGKTGWGDAGGGRIRPLTDQPFCTATPYNFLHLWGEEDGGFVPGALSNSIEVSLGTSDSQ